MSNADAVEGQRAGDRGAARACVAQQPRRGVHRDDGGRRGPAVRRAGRPSRRRSLHSRKSSSRRRAATRRCRRFRSTSRRSAAKRSSGPTSTTAVEALRTMAGVTVQDRGYRNAGVTNGIVIRGINVDCGTNGDVPLAAPPTVATYVDDTALFGNFVLKDIDRIEVLRGPQGTLYGSGSLAGNVRYIMNRPDTNGLRAARPASTSA